MPNWRDKHSQPAKIEGIVLALVNHIRIPSNHILRIEVPFNVAAGPILVNPAMNFATVRYRVL